MSKSEENPSIEDPLSPSPSEWATLVSTHEGEDGMDSRSMTGGRYEEIRRRPAEGRGMREVARALNCSRDTVREVRDGARQSPDAPKTSCDPLWMLQSDWPASVHDLGLGHPLKLIWGFASARDPVRWSAPRGNRPVLNGGILQASIVPPCKPHHNYSRRRESIS
jgi:hypothetical protein